MMTRDAEVPSHVIFRLLLEFCSSFWDSGYVGSEETGAKRGDIVYTHQTLLIPTTLFQRLPLPFPTAQCGVKDWSTTRRKHRGISASQHLGFDRPDLIFSFLSPSPHQQSCPNESDLAERPNLQPSSQKCQKLLRFSKLLSELLSQESYQNSSCDIKQNKYIVIWTEGDVQIPGTHHTSKPKSHQSGTLIWELVQESVCLIIS